MLFFAGKSRDINVAFPLIEWNISSNGGIMDLFWEIHSDLPREAPGSPEDTRRAFARLPDFPPSARVLDIGCGPGAQSLELARLVTGTIVSVDLHPPFLRDLRQRATVEGSAERIHPACMSMTEMGFAPASFDLIWSEGAIYIMGFKAGLRAWKRLLRTGGCLVVTELSWIRPDPPEEPRRFWEDAYPAISTIAANRQVMMECGYREIGTFVLPARSWWNYYDPIVKRVRELEEKYRDDPTALNVLAGELAEVTLYRRFGEYYGYVFYLMQAAK